MDNIHELTSQSSVENLIEEQAADWLVRLDSETPPSAEQLADLKEWMQRSPEHRQQLKRLTQHWHSANRLTELSFPLPGSQRDGLLANLRYQFKQLFSHGWQVTATMGVAVSLTVAIALSLMPFNRDGVSGNGIYETRIGEQNTITLVDGSVIQLNTDSQIQVNYLGSQRNIVLTAGEAHFDVAKDPQRPFVVSAGEGMVRAVGTAFSVRLDQQAVKVIVTEGKVALASSASQPTETMQPTQTLQLAQQTDRGYLEKGQSVIFQPQVKAGLGNQVQELKQKEIDKQLSWRKGLLLFTGEPLAQVVSEVNRYTQLEIQITDPNVAAITIGGQFKVGETEAMLKVLETSFGIQVSRPNPSTVHLALK